MTLICGRWDWQDKLQDNLALRTVLYSVRNTVPGI